MPPLAQRLAAEALGTAFLLAAVVGSGIMAQRLSGGNVALALLCNTLADRRDPGGADPDLRSGVGRAFQSGGQLAFALRRELAWPDAALYIAAQIAGGVVGVWAAHLMFELPLWQVSTHGAQRAGQWLAEGDRDVRAAADDLRLRRARAGRGRLTRSGLYITAAYWFTASTSFANPAVTIARSLSDTFAGIAPAACCRSSSRSWAGRSPRSRSRDGCGRIIPRRNKTPFSARQKAAASPP